MSTDERLASLQAAERSDRRRLLLCRVLLYGAPFVAALLTLSVRQIVLTTGLVNWSDIDGIVLGHGVLAALASAAGAVWLPNPLSIRVAHASSAAVCSAAVYLLLLTIASGTAFLFGWL